MSPRLASRLLRHMAGHSSAYSARYQDIAILLSGTHNVPYTRQLGGQHHSTLSIRHIVAMLAVLGACSISRAHAEGPAPIQQDQVCYHSA